MRKVISFGLLLACMLISACPARAAFTDMASTKYQRAVTELEALKIISGYEDGSFRPDVILSRAEFCTLLVRALGIEDVASSQGETKFSDVDRQHWACGYIAIANNLGFVDGYGDGAFGPEDEVTYIQTLKMLLNSMGYASLAEKNGGYPRGYIVLGTPKLSKGISVAMDSPITRGDAAQLIYNALSMEVLEKQYENDGALTVSGDRTLLSQFMRRRGLSKKEGIVTGTEYTRLTSADGLPHETIEIDGTVYYAGGKSTVDLLGQHVTFYMHDESNFSNATDIYGIWPDEKRNNKISFYAEDISRITENEISYYKDSTGARTAKAELSDSVITIINGVYADATTADWNIKNGHLVLLDNNDDDKYDIVFVNTYTTYMVNAVDSVKEEIGLRVFSDKGESRYRGRTSIEYGNDNEEVIVVDMEGNDINVTDLKPYDIIAVYSAANDRHVTVVRVEGIVKGTVKAVDEEEVIIGETPYEIAINNKGEKLLSLTPGEEGTFWLDVEGRITAKNVTSGQEYSQLVETIDEQVICSYILSYGISTDADDIVTLKVLSNLKNKQRVENRFTLAKTVVVDGRQMTAVEALDKLKATGNGHINIPILYNLNAKEQIKEIKTFKSVAPKDYRKYSKANNSFDGLYFLTSDSIVYYVDVGDYEEVYGGTDISLADGAKYYVDVYDPVDTDFFLENRIYIVYVNLSSAKAPETDVDKPMFVESITHFLDDEDEIRLKVNGFIGGETVSLILGKNAASKLDRIAAGSLLRITKNGLGEIHDFKLLAALPFDKECRTGIGGNNEQVYGRAVSLENNSRNTSVILKVAFGEDQNETVSYEVANCPVYIFNTTRKETELGTLNDIITSQYNAENASTIFVNTVNFNAVAIVVIK